MGRKKSPGLYKRKGFWHIDKQVNGVRVRESTGSNDLAEAESYLAHRLSEIRKAAVYGVRPDRTFREAALRYVQEADIVSLGKVVQEIKILDPYIGTLPLRLLHMDALRPFIHARRAAHRKNRTINYGLEVVRRICNLAAEDWRDADGQTWLERAPKIRLLKTDDARKPCPLTQEEEDAFFAELPDHLRLMAKFKVNTGTREAEVCGLEWAWEIPLPMINASVFLIPSEKVKNRHDRLVVLNNVAKEVVDTQRGK